MTPERWQQVDRLLEMTLDCSTHERAKLLQQFCSDDTDLRHQVEALLHAHDQANSFIEAPPVSAMAEIFHRIEHEDLSGRMIGPYQLARLIGQGGMGVVYLALDQRLNRTVALKILPGLFMREPERVHRFQLEARAASALNHPNILTIYEIGNHDGVHFIATEFIEGITLRQKLTQGPVELKEAIGVANQAAVALAAAHKEGIVHRDIKPENIMIRPDGVVKVLDFGLAKLMDAPSAFPNRSATPPLAKFESFPGMMRGTPQYMSPEQVRGEEVDERTDLFSFGVLLYEMLTGQAPFNGKTPPETLTAILEQSPETILHNHASLPATVEVLILKCLRKERGQRHQSAQEVLAELKHIEASLPNVQVVQRTKPSIAILPFANLSADMENDYFCNGLAEEVLNALAKVESLHVVARTSAFSFKGKRINAQEIGRKLNVSTVLEGSVRQAGNHIRITTRLIRTADGQHLWSERYDRQMIDIFDIQDEITLAIVEALKLKLLADEKSGLLKRHPNNTEAYHLFLMGRFNNHKGTGEGFKKAIEFFEQAIQLEPNYALARVALASTYFSLAFYGFALKETSAKCDAALNGALGLDDSLAEVHLARALFKLYFEWDFPGAEKEFKCAIQLAPNYSAALFAYANYLSHLTRLSEAMMWARRAEEVDPLSLYAGQVLGWVLWYDRRYDEVIVQAQKLLEMEPNYYAAYWMRGLARLHQGNYEEAIIDLQRSVTLGGGLQAISSLGVCYGLAGNREEAEKIIGQLHELKNQQRVQAYFWAIIYASLGDVDKTFAWLKTACEERNDVLLNLQIVPIFDQFRSDPRYLSLLQLIGFSAQEGYYTRN